MTESESVITGPFADLQRPAWPRIHPWILLAVFVGGCFGGLGRYAVTQAWPTPAMRFPWTILVINCAGALLLALLLVLVADVLPPTTYLRPALGTGFCGALTTFSAIVASVDQLIAHGRAWTAVSYLAASVVGGLTAGWIGLVSGRRVAAARRGARRAGGT